VKEGLDPGNMGGRARDLGKSRLTSISIIVDYE
jgi:hypothetical protein